LCHRRNIQTAPRPFSRNRDARGKHINLCVITPCSRKSPGPGFPTAEAFELNGPDRSHEGQKDFQRASAEDWRKSGQRRRATRSDGPGLPSRSLIGADAPIQAQRINAHPLPALSLRGERRGRGAHEVFGKALRKSFSERVSYFI
jgi:hypothetical protein